VTLFDQCFSIVVGIEGVLSLDPNDPGNWSGGHIGVGTLIGTKYGVAAAYHPGLDIPNLTLAEAEEIHLQGYWSPAGCVFLPDRAALVAYDCAVNQGVEVSITLFQKACGITADGVVGAATKQAFGSVTPYHIAHFLALRAERYVTLKGFAADGDGWLSRLFTVSLAPISGDST